MASVTAKTGSNSCTRLGSAITSDTASFFTTDGSYAPTLDGMIGVTISAPGEDQEDVSRGCLINSSASSLLSRAAALSVIWYKYVFTPRSRCRCAVISDRLGGDSGDGAIVAAGNSKWARV